MQVMAFDLVDQNPSIARAQVILPETGATTPSLRMQVYGVNGQILDCTAISAPGVTFTLTNNPTKDTVDLTVNTLALNMGNFGGSATDEFQDGMYKMTYSVYSDPTTVAGDFTFYFLLYEQTRRTLLNKSLKQVCGCGCNEGTALTIQSYMGQIADLVVASENGDYKCCDESIKRLKRLSANICVDC
jgi:hypothetical protein